MQTIKDKTSAHAANQTTSKGVLFIMLILMVFFSIPSCTKEKSKEKPPAARNQF